ncbi:tetratricopeptide repeat protein [Tissierella praeacuta]|uniref:tetratricopeptide repeat protein n=1 Tax=Tissierella praeacuta TaxID=43131 RepID=UPI001C108584|nr:tetratricopeptide repeat protein [Tissierella praeacuta]MBU5256807.1 tetratricopeptide repeat protein [Tissierella praeacuta]
MSGDIKKAENYEKNKMWEDALKEYQLLYEENHKNIHALDKIGWCQSRMGKYKESIKTFKEIIVLEPNKAKWYYTVGYQYYCLKNWNTAMFYFEEAIKRYPDYLIVYYRMGYATSQNLNIEYKEALSQLRKSLSYLNKYESIYIKLDEDGQNRNKSHYVKVLFLKGKILIMFNEIQSAIKILSKAHKLDKSNRDVVYNLSKAYYLSNELDKSSELFKILPNKYYSEELKAKVFIKQKRYSEALSILSKVLNIRQRDYIYRDIAEIYLELDDLDNAYQNAKKAVNLDKGNHKNSFVLGFVYYRYGLLFLCKKMLLDSIEIKDKKYNSKYEEAQKLLIEIDRLIKERNYKEDPTEILNYLESLSRKTDKRYLEGKIAKWFEDKKYGFIRCDKESYFFHISDIDKKLVDFISLGKITTFYLTNSHKGMKAIIVNIKN